MNSLFSTMLFLLALASTLLSAKVNAQQQCHLCATPGDLVQPNRWVHRFANGQTCQDIYVQLNSVHATDGFCSSQKTMAQNTCCNAGSVATGQTGVPAPFVPPPYQGPVGAEPDCPICGTMEYPGIPQGLIVARYVGQFTCDQLYGRGLHGMTSDFMCGPLQDFAAVVCGCGAYNPVCRANPAKCYGAAGSATTITNPVTTTSVPASSASMTAAPNQSPGTSQQGSGHNGVRNLRGDAAVPPPPSRQLTADDMHFTTR